MSHASSTGAAVLTRVLVVEDDPVARDLLFHVFSSQGMAVTCVADATAALEQIAAVDIVLLDGSMPGRDGWSLCRQIKTEIDPLLPVIMVTGRVSRDDVLRSYDAGADDYVAKPFQVPELLARVNTRLRVRRAEAALREAAERYRLVNEATSETIWDWDLTTNRVTWNEGLFRVFGHVVADTPETAEWWLSNVHPDDRNRVYESYTTALQSTSRVWNAEYRFRRADGTYAYVFDRSFISRNNSGQPLRAIGSMLDWSLHRQLEQRLHLFSEASAAFGRSLEETNVYDALARVSAELASLAIVCAREEGGMFRVHSIHARNEAALHGIGPEVRRFPEDEPLLRAAARAGPGRLHGEAEARAFMQLFGAAPDIPVRQVITAPVYVDERVGALLVLAAVGSDADVGDADIDIAAELARRAATALVNARLYRVSLRAEERYRLLFASNPQPMWVVDRATLRFLDVNDAARTHYGFSPDAFARMTLDDVDVEKARNRTVGQYISRHRRADDTIIDVELTVHDLDYEGVPARLMLIVDVTERLRAEAALRHSEEQLRQAVKMEAVGRLAGGVAHDFNNLLTAIQGYAQILLADGGKLVDAREELSEISRAAERATALTRQLLAFGRRQVLQPRVVNVNDVITDMERMLVRLIGEDIRLITELADEVHSVRADPDQLQQVLLNLVVNARDAMPDGGRLTIATRNVNVLHGDARSKAGLLPGAYVCIRVIDTGTGIDPDVLERVFEPFFTTKPQGKGTGLGLSTAYGIVVQTGGTLIADSQPGRGATFSVFLPGVDQPSQAMRVSAVQMPDPDAIVRRATILLVEDEPSVRLLCTRILRRYGFDVLEAANGRQALDIASGFDANIDLLVTDVVMPEMGGREVADALALERPHTRVLFMSGYTEDAIVRHGVQQGSVAFLAKPFSPASFIEKVVEQLEAG